MQNASQVSQHISNLPRGYKTLMNMMAVNFSWYQQTQSGIPITYLRNELNVGPNEYSIITGGIGFPWNLKPVYGIISDTFFPMKFRMKFYVPLMCSMIILCSLILAISPRSVGLYRSMMFLISLGFAFIDTMAEGASAVITKLNGRV